MNKLEWWPNEGKAKKAGIILVIIIVASLLMTLVEEKGFTFTKKIPFLIAMCCLAVWFYQPAKKENV
jgi:phage-related holin